VRQNKLKRVVLAVMAAAVMPLAGAADHKNTKVQDELTKPPPYQVPLFDGSKDRTKAQPTDPLVMPTIPNARELFDLVVSCWPEKSWFRGELSMEARLTRNVNNASSTGSTNNTTTANGATSTTSFDPVSGQYQTTTGNYIGIVGRIPLWSATELDKEREREVSRRGVIAGAVGTYVSALAEHKLTERELDLHRALEKRTQERVALGIVETREQVNNLEKVASLEGKMIKTSAELIKSRVTISGMCDDRKAWVIDEYLKRFNVVQ
jgi:hypothetical protein